MVEEGRLLAAIEAAPTVRIAGPEPVGVTTDRLAEVEISTAAVEIVCATGSSYTADWTGPTLGSLLETAEVDPETTHVLVESADEYRVAIPIREAIGGILGFLKDGSPIGAAQEYANRLVCPGTEGARDIKGVAEVEPVVLDPGEDPEALENLFPEGERFTANRYEKDEDEIETA